MDLLLSIIPLATLLLLFAGLLKLSARLVRGTRVTWRHSFVFAFAVVVIGLVLRVSVAASGVRIPVAAGVVLALGAYVAFGAWYLRQRAHTADGQAVGVRGAALLSTLTCGLLGALAAAAVGLTG